MFAWPVRSATTSRFAVRATHLYLDDTFTHTVYAARVSWPSTGVSDRERHGFAETRAGVMSDTAPVAAFMENSGSPPMRPVSVGHSSVALAAAPTPHLLCAFALESIVYVSVELYRPAGLSCRDAAYTGVSGVPGPKLLAAT